jgi:hypothetical protein
MTPLNQHILEGTSLRAAIESVDLSLAHRPVCEDFVVLFGRASESSVHSDTLRFLAVVCGWRLKPEISESPFEPAMSGDNWQTPSWDEITSQQVSVIEAVAPAVADPELRSRLCDLVWVVARRHEHARIAASAYLESAERLIARHDILGEKNRLLRSVQLASQLGRDDRLLTEIVERITAIATAEDVATFSLSVCLDALLLTRVADATRCFELARNRAIAIRDSESKPIWERRFWELAAAFAGREKDQDARRQSLTEVARTFEVEARACPSKAVAATFWEMALHAYRRVPGTETEREAALRALLQSQEGIKDEMFSAGEVPVDLSESFQLAVARVTGKAPHEAIAELVFASRWPVKSRIRDEAGESIKRFPLQHLFSSVRFGSTWKVAGKAPGVGSDTDIASERLHAEMCQQYKYFVPIFINATIEPMRHEILRAHQIGFDTIADFVTYSPLVPTGREEFFVRGIHHGLYGRFLESAHVLIPQLEFMLRCVHWSRGTITSSINDSGIQQEFDLNRILVMPETESLLGEDLTFFLRVLFMERYGYNLRNEMSHGMAPAATFYADAVKCAWWVVFHLAGRHAADAIRSQRNEQSATASSANSA